MEKELINFIRENNLGPFQKESVGRDNGKNIFKTKDAKSIFQKTLSKIAENFRLESTKTLFEFFDFTNGSDEILRRQDFFRTIKKSENQFLRELKTPESIWAPKYDITVVTSNEKTFMDLKKMGCPAKFVTSEEDVKYLEDLDIIQVIDAEEIEAYLEQLPQTVFMKNLEEVYLERYLELLSGWKKNLEILKSNNQNLIDEANSLVNNLSVLMNLINDEKKIKLTKEQIEEKIEEINSNINEKIKTLNFSGEVLIKIISGFLPKELETLINQELENSNIPEEIIIKGMPLKIDERELSKFLKEQDSNEFVNLSEKIRKYSKELKNIPMDLRRLEIFILLTDFYSGISKFISENKDFPQVSDKFEIVNSRNILIESPQPISFSLDSDKRCSILTGANSGGKTTLLEHIIQIITQMQIGLPVNEKSSIPLFTDIYYFAKNKGSTSKGAFETLLTQMSKISPGEKTLILADEIESVTEPGVAGKILCATADYFIRKNCFLIIATHLGSVIQKNLPEHARIDGIEAKGLSETNELIVDHNPVLGKLANSTPELIVEKMAREQGSDYIKFISEYVRKAQ